MTDLDNRLVLRGVVELCLHRDTSVSLPPSDHVVHGEDFEICHLPTGLDDFLAFMAIN